MSQEDIDALKNASAIIERFGGIRPMAAKVGAPVTTVQGWKKRDVIPGGRREDVIRAANENSIDLSDILSDAPKVTSATVANVEKGVKADESAFIETAKSAANSNLNAATCHKARPPRRHSPTSAPTVSTAAWMPLRKAAVGNTAATLMTSPFRSKTPTLPAPGGCWR